MRKYVKLISYALAHYTEQNRIKNCMIFQECKLRHAMDKSRQSKELTCALLVVLIFEGGPQKDDQDNPVRSLVSCSICPHIHRQLGLKHSVHVWYKRSICIASKAI